MKMSSKGLETLERMEYPGRLIIIGRDPGGEHNVVVYAITGRSPSSQARELVWDGEETVKTRNTDATQLKAGDESLLIYNCIRRFHDALVVGNGAQTDLIVQTMEDLRGKGVHLAPAEILARAFAQPHLVEGMEGERIDLSSYEPDGPAFTPRISGCVARGAALSIIRCAQDGSASKHYFEVPMIPRRGKLITTYAGENINPLPSFRGEPLDVELRQRTAQEVAEAVYGALASRHPGKDFRVGVAALFSHTETSKTQFSIVNRHAREK